MEKNKEEYIIPNGAKVTFYPEHHIYEVNGRQVPSITTLLSDFYGDSYKNVNPSLLKRSADYGTAVHAELQNYIDKRLNHIDINPIKTDYQEVENYFNFTEPIYKIKPIMTEKVVVLYDTQNSPCAAGRFDLLCTVGDKLTLADFKTTSSIHRKLVTAQLNLYLKAAKESGYLKEDEDVQLGVIHLSGSTSRFIPIPILGENYCLQFIANEIKY